MHFWALLQVGPLSKALLSQASLDTLVGDGQHLSRISQPIKNENHSQGRKTNWHFILLRLYTCIRYNAHTSSQIKHTGLLKCAAVIYQDWAPAATVCVYCRVSHLYWWSSSLLLLMAPSCSLDSAGWSWTQCARPLWDTHTHIHVV